MFSAQWPIKRGSGRRSSAGSSSVRARKAATRRKSPPTSSSPSTPRTRRPARRRRSSSPASCRRPSAATSTSPPSIAPPASTTSEQGRVDKATQLLSTLPAETPKDVKKQIVEASLKAFGYPDRQDHRGRRAGDPGARGLHPGRASATPRRCSPSRSKRIAELEAEIARIKQVMDEQVAEQYALDAAPATRQKLEVQQVLEFFGQEAVARVVRESPKLHEPKPDA